MSLVPVIPSRTSSERAAPQAGKQTPQVTALPNEVLRLIFSYLGTGSRIPHIWLTCGALHRVFRSIRTEAMAIVSGVLFGEHPLSVPRPLMLVSTKPDAEKKLSESVEDQEELPLIKDGEAIAAGSDPENWLDAENPFEALRRHIFDATQVQLEVEEHPEVNQYLVQILSRIQKRKAECTDATWEPFYHLAVAVVISCQTHLWLLPQRCSGSCVGLCTIKSFIPNPPKPLLQYVDELFLTVGLTPQHQEAWRYDLLRNLGTFDMYGETGSCHDIVVENFSWLVDRALERNDYPALLRYYQQEDRITAETPERKECIYRTFQGLVKKELETQDIGLVLRYMHQFSRPDLADDLLKCRLLSACFQALRTSFFQSNQIHFILEALAQALISKGVTDTLLIDSFMQDLMCILNETDNQVVLPTILPNLKHGWSAYFEDSEKQEGVIGKLLIHPQGVSVYDVVARSFSWSQERIWSFVATQGSTEVKRAFLVIHADSVRSHVEGSFLKIVGDLCAADAFYGSKDTRQPPVSGKIHALATRFSALADPLRAIYTTHIDSLLQRGQSVAIPLQELFPCSSLREATEMVDYLQQHSTAWDSLAPHVALYLTQVVNHWFHRFGNKSIQTYAEERIRGMAPSEAVPDFPNLADMERFLDATLLIAPNEGADLKGAVAKWCGVPPMSGYDRVCTLASLCLVQEASDLWSIGLPVIVFPETQEHPVGIGRALSFLSRFRSVYRSLSAPNKELSPQPPLAFCQAYDAVLSRMMQIWSSPTIPRREDSLPVESWKQCAAMAAQDELLCQQLIPMLVMCKQYNHPMLLDELSQGTFSKDTFVEYVLSFVEEHGTRLDYNSETVKQIIIRMLVTSTSTIESHAIVQLLLGHRELCNRIGGLTASDIVATGTTQEAQQARIVSLFEYYKDSDCTTIARELLTSKRASLDKGVVIKSIRERAKTEITDKKRALLEALWESLSFFQHPWIWVTIGLQLLGLRMSASRSQKEGS